MRDNLRCSLLIFLFTLTVAISGSAIADAPPPPPEDYEATCTLKIQHKDDFDCFECLLRDSDAPEEDDNEERCDPEAHIENGYEKKCASSVWDEDLKEIWCKPSPGTKGAASKSDDDGCSAVRVGHATSSLIKTVFRLLF